VWDVCESERRSLNGDEALPTTCSEHELEVMVEVRVRSHEIAELEIVEVGRSHLHHHFRIAVGLADGHCR
jgi:hypothetical protein